jgi:hypothetical protein
MPLVEVSIQGGIVGPDAAQVADELRSATPSIRVDTSRAHAGILVLVPTCLRSGDPEYIGRAFARVMKR